MVRKAHNLQREPRRIGGENRACALRLKRVDSATSVHHFLLSVRDFEEPDFLPKSTTNENSIFLWTIRFSYSRSRKRFMDEWKIHRMLIYNISKCVGWSETILFPISLRLTQTWINLIIQRFLYINFLRSFRPWKVFHTNILTIS